MRYIYVRIYMYIYARKTGARKRVSERARRRERRREARERERAGWLTVREGCAPVRSASVSCASLADGITLSLLSGAIRCTSYAIPYYYIYFLARVRKRERENEEER